MKIDDVKEYETGKHCFGMILSVNGTDYEDLDVEDAIELINDVMRHGYNKDSFIKETFEAALSYLEFDCVKSDSSSCDQYVDWNFYEKWVKDE